MSPNPPQKSLTLHRETPCGVVNVIISNAPTHIWFRTSLGKAGGCAGAHTTVAWKLAELAIKSGASLQQVSEVMSGHGCHLSSPHSPSCIAAVSSILEEFLEGPKS